ncbi:hypothetical protein [Roseomonas populi]|uniref:DUF4268 domain-containing protein n=1 Tax=Roseomonas populi TaxID=3121582 RepID=A0ABT1XAZ1_9PROT|nr:hypothetical protein [Roseomonas pecuniae]MCR0985288.1 hypothetical protein [Roseomonas pecuniae]
MNRQHTTPILLPASTGIAVPLAVLDQRTSGSGVTEATIQDLVYSHPTCLPISEIDPMFEGPVSICTELNTPAGPIDVFMITPSGLPVIVECKLWRNPEGRREVVGQILDYAKELSRWSSSDLQREVSRRVGQQGNPLLARVREAAPNTEEVRFNDAVTQNLRRGRFLLLIVGDGIREGVEAIAEYLQAHAGLHFSLGLVELPIYALPDGSRLVAPRVLARTQVLRRTVIALPEGYALQEQQAPSPTDIDPETDALANERLKFWTEFLTFLRLDDPEQATPRPSRQGYITLSLPAPAGTSWLTVYRDLHRDEVGVFLSSSRNSAGEYAMRAIAEDWSAVEHELGGTAKLSEKDGRPRIADALVAAPLTDPEKRRAAFSWLAQRVNTFVNVMRPRVRSAVVSYQAPGGEPTS